MTKELSISAVARLLGVSQKWVRVLIEKKFLRRPLTEARVKAGWSEYERTKKVRRARAAAPPELASALADERARSLEIRTGLLDRTLLDRAKVNSDLDKFVAAVRNGMYGAVANLPIPAQRAGEDAADALMRRLAAEAGTAAVELGGPEFAVPEDPSDEERAAILNAALAPEPAALPEPAFPLNGKAREARSRLLWRRTRNNNLEATTIPRRWAEAMLDEYAKAARREMAVADIGAPLAGAIEALDALIGQIISEWRSGVSNEAEDENDDDE